VRGQTVRPGDMSEVGDLSLRTVERLFSIKGRLGRLSFGLSAGLLLTVFWVLEVFVERTLGRTATLLLYPPLYFFLAVLSVKRFHDAARSGWWLLVGLVPVLGLLWVLFELAFRKGTPGSNQYGEDPETKGRDYLVVS
jgi:uncharacterized membrane protein YhaH (DUF805 family)